MNRTLSLLLAGLLVLTGCAHGYVMTLSNGDRIKTASKPRLKNGFYYYKDASGGDAAPVFSGRVSEIAPASMAGDAKKSEFRFNPSK